MSIQLLRLRVAQARRLFFGIRWPTGPDTAARALQALADLVQVRDEEVEFEGEASSHTLALMRGELNRAIAATEDACWMPRNGGYSSQRFWTGWEGLRDRLDTLTIFSTGYDVDVTLVMAQDAAGRERDYVAGRAEVAAAYGMDALAAAERGDWEDACEDAARAVRTEAEFGAVPAWGPVLELCETMRDAQ